MHAQPHNKVPQGIAGDTKILHRQGAAGGHKETPQVEQGDTNIPIRTYGYSQGTYVRTNPNSATVTKYRYCIPDANNLTTNTNR